MIDIAHQLGGREAFFTDSPTQFDYVTDLNLLECGKVLALLPIDRAARRMASATWPRQDDTLAMPAGMITFSNEDLCHPRPNHNRPIYLCIIHRDKLIRRASVDTGASINILPYMVFLEQGYSDGNLCPDFFVCSC